MMAGSCLRVLADRGLAGIDGAAINGDRGGPDARPGLPYALLGDLSYSTIKTGCSWAPQRVVPISLSWS